MEQTEAKSVIRIIRFQGLAWFSFSRLYFWTCSAFIARLCHHSKCFISKFKQRKSISGKLQACASSNYHDSLPPFIQGETAQVSAPSSYYTSSLSARSHQKKRSSSGFLCAVKPFKMHYSRHNVSHWECMFVYYTCIPIPEEISEGCMRDSTWGAQVEVTRDPPSL